MKKVVENHVHPWIDHNRLFHPGTVEESINSISEELVNVLDDAGLKPDHTKKKQLCQAIEILVERKVYEILHFAGLIHEKPTPDVLRKKTSESENSRNSSESVL